MLKIGNIYDSAINEGVSDERSLRILARYILMTIAKRILGTVKEKSDPTGNARTMLDTINISAEMITITTDDLKYNNGKIDDNIKDFIKNSGVMVTVNHKKNGAEKGVFETGSKVIRLFVTTNDIDNYYDMINRNENNEKDTNEYDIMSWLNRNKSTLIHELQHAYDDFRTDGKIFNTKAAVSFFNNRSSETQTNAGEMSDTLYNKYVNLNHEINARYNQAIEKIDLYTTDIVNDDFVNTKIPFEKVKNKFAFKFFGWNLASESTKRQLIKRLYKYYVDETKDLS